MMAQARCGNAPGPGWTRPRGRPRTTWAEQLSRDIDGMSLWGRVNFLAKNNFSLFSKTTSD